MDERIAFRASEEDRKIVALLKKRMGGVSEGEVLRRLIRAADLNSARPATVALKNNRYDAKTLHERSVTAVA